jgi:DNA-directed RNA polymerase subunit beta'
MMRRVTVTEPGNTDLLPGQLVDRFEFAGQNDRMLAEGNEPAVASAVLLGITKASLATESYLSAASFQETTRVLTDAAIAGKQDSLMGLKENVIIGKLIPAATGMRRYRDIHLTYKGERADWPPPETADRGPLPQFAPEQLKELEAMLPAPSLIDEGAAITEDEASAFFADLSGGGSSETTETTEAPELVVKDLDVPDEDRCEALKADGDRCRNKALEGARYCRVHEDLARTDGMCKALLASGKPCKNAARDGSDYCGVHSRMEG